MFIVICLYFKLTVPPKLMFRFSAISTGIPSGFIVQIDKADFKINMGLQGPRVAKTIFEKQKWSWRLSNFKTFSISKLIIKWESSRWCVTMAQNSHIGQWNSWVQSETMYLPVNWFQQSWQDHWSQNSLQQKMLRWLDNPCKRMKLDFHIPIET